MNPYAFLIVLVIVILFITVLPMLSGIGKFGLGDQKINTSKKAMKFNLRESKEEGDKSSIASSRSFNIKDTYEADAKHGLKKRGVSKYTGNDDPNQFDFDVDDLINEDRKEEEAAIYKRRQECNGKERETYESFV
ncbi:Exp1p KNAG_0A05460 [Huiozyma naganishii CBS 8797]|uniref:Uncharacterized protein n=1 Tax=Huiozyma naganishii (strain ATCC MYA-139 / BCRC 22969 / CBS 8797 / KCTC 17520 / NBRC 10181 / NCYC 3082 / Yp74L-3) TaxID=1071383 RepID=J7S3V5_HUIN7|nr:hypothetical protein KNAG_0A05460 [Kazachstania naganishii CBS 8797]CCK68211.1 hypothetical protein KNAG_0A05460 [Kazachstania naganishii CBS 8797]